jgi:urea transport system substrate-binding protein
MTGDFAAWNYFQSQNRPEYRVRASLSRLPFRAQRVTSDPMESAYTSVHLWADPSEASGTDEVKAVRQLLRQQSFDGPGGPVRVDPETQHLYKTFRLGRSWRTASSR